MKKRGLSPVVATVGLIVIALALFFIIFFWTRSFMKEKVMKFGYPIEDMCDDVAWNVGLSDSTITISNNGNVNIWKIMVVKYLPGKKVTEFYSASGEPDEALPAGEAASFEINTDGASKIEIYPVLLGKGEKSAKNYEYVCKNKFERFEF
jgi:hypothetical protein